MNNLLIERIHLVSQQPLVYAAFLSLVFAGVWKSYINKTQKYISSLQDLPSRDKLTGLQLLVLGFPKELTKKQLKVIQQRNTLAAFVIALSGFLLLAALIIHYWSMPANEITKKLGHIETQNEDERLKIQQLTNKIENSFKIISDVQLKLKYLTENPSSNDDRKSSLSTLIEKNKLLQSDLASSRSLLVEYERRYGKIMEIKNRSGISVAINSLSRVNELLDAIAVLGSQDIELNAALAQSLRDGNQNETLLLQRKKESVEAKIKKVTEELERMRGEGQEGLTGFKNAYV